MLKMENLSFGYIKDRMIVDDFSIKIPYKKIGIFGENGIGKTTMLNLIDQKYKYKGKIYVNGRTYFPKDLFSKYAKLKVKEIIDLIKCLDSFNCYSINKYITELRLEKYLDYEIENLSKGTTKKITILFALLSNAETILLDEPFESIDRESNINLCEIIKCKENNFIIVSHDLEFLKLSTDMIYEMKDGKLYEK